MPSRRSHPDPIGVAGGVHDPLLDLGAVPGWRDAIGPVEQLPQTISGASSGALPSSYD
jgi:hypothetical protein